VIYHGTTEHQKTVFGTLADIAEKSALLEAPALIVVGEVVVLKDALSWFVPGSDNDKMAGSVRFIDEWPSATGTV
jgi:hypothetical protein